MTRRTNSPCRQRVGTKADATRRRFLQAAGALVTGSVGAAAFAESAEDTAQRRGNGGGQPTRTRHVDVLVCGGGPAGMAAAVLAARQGAKVLLVERYGRLGGMAVQGLVGPLMGRSESAFVEEVLRRIGGRQADPNRLDLEYAALVQEAGAELLLHAWAAEATTDGRRVTGAKLLTKGGFVPVEATVTVDATGDGDVAFSAGAAFEQGRPGDGLVQPMSIMYRLVSVDETKALACGSEQEARKIRVPEGTWEEVVIRGQQAGELAATIGVVRLYRTQRPGERIVNATQVNGGDGTVADDLTRAELEGRRQAYQVLEFLRKHAPGYEQAHIALMPAVVGVRETRRFLGRAHLTRDDLVAGKKWPDAVVRSASFPIDIHNPAGSGQAEGRAPGSEGIAAAVKPYDIPYGCLVPRNTDGLLLAGRCISGSHDAHASYRVQCIAMAIGTAAGAAAAVAAKQQVSPAAIDVRAVQKLLRLL
jgi:hypothetical protein